MNEVLSHGLFEESKSILQEGCVYLFDNGQLLNLFLDLTVIDSANLPCRYQVADIHHCYFCLVPKNGGATSLGTVGTLTELVVALLDHHDVE